MNKLYLPQYLDEYEDTDGNEVVMWVSICEATPDKDKAYAETEFYRASGSKVRVVEVDG